MKKMTGNFKRWLSLLMSVVMIATQFPLPVMAEGETTDPYEEEVVVSEEKENDPEEDPYLNVVSYEADPGVNIVWINATFDEPLTPIGETAASAKAEDYYPGMGILLVASANQAVDNDVDEHVVTTFKNDDYEYRSRTEHLAYGYNAAYMFPCYGELLFEPGTTYHYRLALQVSSESLVYLTPDSTFTTGTDKDITADFTDPYLLSVVMDAIGLNGEDPVMLSYVESETDFSMASGKGFFGEYAESLAGIENFKSLLSINISYHNIKGISEITSLKYLSVLNMPGNDIRELPDLSGLIYLGYNDSKQMQGMIDLDYNVIVKTSVTVDKLPAGYVDITLNPVERGGGGFQRDWPVVEPRLARDNTYYQIGEKHPLLVEFDGLKTQHESTYPYNNVRDYTVRAFIGEDEYVLNRHNSTNLFICEDISDVTLNTPISVTILIADNTGTTLWEGSRTVTFKGDIDTIAHITVNGTDFFDVVEGNKPSIVFANGDNWGMVVTGSWLDEEISAVLVGEDGESHAVAFEDEGTSSAASYYENRYCDMINDGGVTWTINSLEGTVQRTVLGTVSVIMQDSDKSWFVPGDYSLKITKSGDEDYTTIATVTVTEGSVVGAVGVSEKFDNSGEYIYVETLVSHNCFVENPRESYPTLYLNGKAVTEFDPSAADATFDSHYGIVYKLKKTGTDSVWNNPQKFTYSFTNAVVNAVSVYDTTIYYEPLEQGFGDYAYTLAIAGNAERIIAVDATDTLTINHTEPTGDLIFFNPAVWTSSDPSVVTVEYERFGADTATVKATGEGEAWVTVTYGGLTAFVKYTVSSTAVKVANITLAGVDRSLDNRGDSIYIYVNGNNIDTKKIWPVIKSVDGKVSYTTTASATVITDATGTQSCLYTVKKGENWSVIKEAADDAKFLLSFGTEEGYKWTDSRGEDDKTVEGWELKDISPYMYMIVYYNCRKKALEVFGPADDFAGKEFTIATTVVIKGADSTNVTEEASGSGKFDASGRALVTMKDADGNVYVPSSELGFADYSITVEGMEKYESSIYNAHPWEYGTIREMTAEEAKAWACVLGVSKTEEPEVKDGYIRFYDGATGPYTVMIYELARQNEEAVKEFEFTEDQFDSKGFYTFTDKELEGLKADEVYSVVAIDSTGHSVEGSGFITTKTDSKDDSKKDDNNNNNNNNNQTEDTTPTPAPDAPQHNISVIEGAVAKNSAGVEVQNAKENETISISWTPKADYDFVKWELTGATPKEPVSANTVFVMGKEDVIVSYDDKLKIADQILEEIPSEAEKDKEVKISGLKFNEKKLTLLKGSDKENPAVVKEAKGVEAPKVYYVTENKDIVAVDQNGKFYATGLGEATVTAYCGNRKATVKVAVVCHTKDISILNSDMEEKEVIEMKGGETEFLTVSFKPYDTTDSRVVTWKTKSKKIATINKGVLTAKEVKEAAETEIEVGYKVINAEGKTEKKTKTIKVKVTPAKADANSSADSTYSIKLAKKKVKLTTAEADATNSTAELTLNLTAKTADLTTIVTTAASTNDDIVSVKEIGAVTANGKKGTVNVKIEAKGAGSAYIVVRTRAAGAEKENVQVCKVTVTSPAKGLIIKSGTLTVDASAKQKTMTLRKGISGTIEYATDPANSTDLSKLKISGKKGITVKNGVIYAKKVTDSAVITVKCGKHSETINVKITK